MFYLSFSRAELRIVFAFRPEGGEVKCGRDPVRHRTPRAVCCVSLPVLLDSKCVHFSSFLVRAELRIVFAFRPAGGEVKRGRDRVRHRTPRAVCCVSLPANASTFRLTTSRAELRTVFAFRPGSGEMNCGDMCICCRTHNASYNYCTSFPALLGTKCVHLSSHHFPGGTPHRHCASQWRWKDE